MKPAVFFLLLILTFGLSSQSRFDITFECEGKNRTFIAVKPTGVMPEGGYPVVFMFHGTSGDGEKFYNISGWKEEGEKEKFISVFPTSLEYCVLSNETGNPVKTTKWNCGDLLDSKCPDLSQDFKDDVLFVRKMVDTLTARFDINPAKNFASGFSNGCVFVNKLAVDAPDIFSAVAGSGGLFNVLDSITPVLKIPIWNMAGTLDDRFTSAVGISPLPFGGDSIIFILQKPTKSILDIEGLTFEYTKNLTPITNSFIFNTPKPGQKPNTYIFTLVKNMTHQYPNKVNYPLSAAEIFWKFFNQIAPTSSNDIPVTDNKINIYPNPSNDKMTIELLNLELGKPYNITVYNILGQPILSRRELKQNTLQICKNEVGSGVFFMLVHQGVYTQTKKIVFE
ncbi:MAG: T9SS type A sorting domain-containing protein [Saprospiraceae bacterium]|nr:T9SS type A sorting domain-containing protein [Saprospiraceae bacterium]